MTEQSPPNNSAPPPHSTAKPAVIMALFVLITTSLIMLAAALTRDAMEENQRRSLEAQLDQVFPAHRRNNPILATARIIDAPSLTSGAPVTLYQAQMNHQVTGLVFAMSTGEGYNGTIRLLIGMDATGTLTGVRVILPHHETPGLGDKIETSKSDWILGFTGTSLSFPLPGAWAVKKDGGAFDQFTGATITPRAVVGAVKATLDYFQAHQHTLLTLHKEHTE